MSNRFSWFNVTSIVIGFAFLYIPILLLIIYSFNESKLVTVWGGWSTKWYSGLLSNEGLMDAAWVTLWVGLISATLATILGTMAALVLTRDVIGNHAAKNIIDLIGVALREGTDFTEPLRKSHVFPPMVTSLLRIGAESGSLPASALRLADMYESKLEIAMQRLVRELRERGSVDHIVHFL